MTQAQPPAREEPAVTISYELTPAVYTLLMSREGFSQALIAALSVQVSDLMRVLGIPGAPVVQLAPIDLAHERASYWLRLVVGDRLCRYSHELLIRVHSYVSDSLLFPTVQSGPILTWLTSLSLEKTEERAQFLDFLACACLEILKQQPRVLLGTSQATAYAQTLPLPERVVIDKSSWPPDPSWLHPILSAVLSLKISLADRQKVALVLATLRTQKQQAIAEALIEALRSDIIEIHIASTTLQQLTGGITPASREAGTFSALRSELFREYGLRFPDFRFVKDSDMRPGSVALKIHNLLLLPWKLLETDSQLVNMLQSNMQQTYQQTGIAALHPYYWWENCVVQSENLPTFQELCWNAWDYLKFCLKHDLQEQAPAFIYTQNVQARLDRLTPTQGALITAVRSKQSLEEVTSLLRTLAQQGISTRTLVPILERWLDTVFLAANSSKSGLIDYSLTYIGPILEIMRESSADYLASFIRSGLTRSIANTFFPGATSIDAWLLDPSIETTIAQKLQQHEQVVFSDSEIDRILDMLHTKVATLSTIDIPPLILVQMYARSTVQDMVARELPRIAVLAIQEVGNTPINQTILSIGAPIGV
jgi:flagellar biosynthesis component FlhA